MVGGLIRRAKASSYAWRAFRALFMILLHLFNFHNLLINSFHARIAVERVRRDEIQKAGTEQDEDPRDDDICSGDAVGKNVRSVADTGEDSLECSKVSWSCDLERVLACLLQLSLIVALVHEQRLEELKHRLAYLVHHQRVPRVRRVQPAQLAHVAQNRLRLHRLPPVRRQDRQVSQRRARLQRRPVFERNGVVLERDLADDQR